MGLVIVGVIGRWVPDVRAEHQQARLVGHVLGGEQRRLQGVAVVRPLTEFDDVPSVRTEAPDDVVGDRQFGDAVDSDVVVVEHADQPTQPEMAGERCCLVADALHQAAVAGDHIRMVIDELWTESVAEEPLGDRHPDGVAEALAQRAGGDLDACGEFGLGMSWRERLPAAEGLDVVEVECRTREVEHRVLEDRGVTVGHDEPVAIWPLGVGRIELHHPREEHVGEGSERHRGALVPALGVQRGIHGEPTDQRDRLCFLLGGESGGHRGDLTRQGAGASRVNGTTCHGPWSIRQCAKTVPYSANSNSPRTRR